MLPKAASSHALAPQKGTAGASRSAGGNGMGTGTGTGMRRIASAPGAIYDIVQDVAQEFQLESMTRTPAFAAGACTALSPNHPQHATFPMDLLTSPGRDEGEAVAIVGACLASPPDGDCTRKMTPYRLGESAVDDRDEGTLDRWMRIWLARRRRKTTTTTTTPAADSDSE